MVCNGELTIILAYIIIFSLVILAFTSVNQKIYANRKRRLEIEVVKSMLLAEKIKFPPFPAKQNKK